MISSVIADPCISNISDKATPVPITNDLQWN